MFRSTSILLILIVALTSCGDSANKAKSNPPSSGPALKVGNVDTQALNSSPQVVYNSEGNGIAVWIVTNSLNKNLLYSVYNHVENSWSLERSLGVVSTLGNFTSIQLKSLGTGFGVLWFQNDGVFRTLFAGVHSGTVGQDFKLTVLEKPVSNTNYSNLNLTVGQTGYAVSWSSYLYGTSYKYSTKASVYANGMWNTTTLVNIDSPYSHSFNDFSLQASGDKYAILWRTYFYDGINTNNLVQASVYEDGIWSTEALHNTSTTYATYFYNVSLRSNQSGFAIHWLSFYFDSTNYIYSFKASVYAQQAWNTVDLAPVLVNTTPVNIAYFSFIPSKTGYAIVWQEFFNNGSNNYAIRAHAYNGTNWSSNNLFPATSTTNNYNFNALNLTTNGDTFVAVWSHSFFDTVNNNYFIRAGVFDGVGWTTSDLITPIVTTIGYSFNSLQLVSNGSTYAASWYFSNYDGVNYNYGVRGTLYNAGSWAPATDLSTISSASFYNFSNVILQSNGTSYILVWHRENISSTPERLVFATTNSGSNNTWGAVVQLNDITNANILNVVKIANAKVGDGYLVSWNQTYNGVSTLFGNIYQGAGSSEWNGSVRLSAIASVVNWTVNSNDSGFGLVWNERAGLNSYNLYSRIYTDNWADIHVLENRGGNNYYFAFDSVNNQYHVFWQNYIDSNHVELYVNSFSESWMPNSTNMTRSGHVWGSGITPFMASNDSGETIAVWQDSDFNDNQPYKLFVAFYRNNRWEESKILYETVYYYPYGVSVISDGRGFLVTWLQSGYLYSIVYNENGWSSAVPLGINGAHNHTSKSDKNGYMVVWEQYTFPYNTIMANVYDDNKWSSGIILNDTSLAERAFSPRLVANDNGYAVTWVQVDGGLENIYANVYSGSGWNLPVKLDLDTINGNVSNPRITSSGTGYGAVWSQYDNRPGVQFYDVYTSLYTYAENAWSNAQLIDKETVKGDALAPDIAANGSSYVVAWQQFDGETTNIYARKYNGDIWGNVDLLDNTAVTTATAPHVLSNGTGFAVLWNQENNGLNDLFVSVYPEANWTEPQKINAVSELGSMQGAQIVSNGQGYCVVWQQSSGSNFKDIVSRTYLDGDWKDIVTMDIDSIKGDAYSPRLSRLGSKYGITWVQNNPFELPLKPSGWAVVGF